MAAVRGATPAGVPDQYGEQRAADGSAVVEAIRAAGGRAHGVEADLVWPPPTDTGWVTDEVRAEADGRIAAPDDVAEVIAWLASDAAGWVTGNVIRML